MLFSTTGAVLLFCLELIRHIFLSLWVKAFAECIRVNAWVCFHMHQCLLSAYIHCPDAVESAPESLDVPERDCFCVLS